MGVTTTTALILRHYDERERDRSVIVLTPEQGLLRLRARGTKSSVSKLAGSLEPLSEVTLSFADGRTSGLITGSILIDRYSGLRDDLVSLVAAQWLAELIEHVARPGQAMPELWDLVKQSWQSLIDQQDWSLGRRWLALDQMAWRILKLEGFIPALDHCPRCTKPMPAADVAYDPLVGFVHVEEAGASSIHLSKKSIDYLMTGESSGEEKSVWRESHQLLAAIIDHTIERPLKSNRVLHSAFRTARLSLRDG